MVEVELEVGIGMGLERWVLAVFSSMCIPSPYGGFLAELPSSHSSLWLKIWIMVTDNGHFKTYLGMQFCFGVAFADLDANPWSIKSPASGH